VGSPDTCSVRYSVQCRDRPGSLLPAQRWAGERPDAAGSRLGESDRRALSNASSLSITPHHSAKCKVLSTPDIMFYLFLPLCLSPSIKCLTFQLLFCIFLKFSFFFYCLFSTVYCYRDCRIPGSGVYLLYIFYSILFYLLCIYYIPPKTCSCCCKHCK